MRTFLLASMLLILSLSPLIDVSAKTSSVILNEVQITGGTGHSNDDFIELFNNSSFPANLTGWKLKKKIKTGTESTVYDFSVASDEKIIIPSNGYFLWANKDGALAENTETNFTNDTILSDNYSLALLDADNNLVDALTYGSGHVAPYMPSITYASNPTAKTSLERDIENDVYILQNSPSPANDAFIEKQIIMEDYDDDEKTSSTDLTIRINEIFPNPKEKGEAGEFIELFNFGTENLTLDGLVVRDASATGKYIFPASSSIASGEYFLLKKEVSKISLNNSDESVSLFDTEENLLDTVSYDKTKEGASFGFDDDSFRWSQHLTPGEANKFDTSPENKTSIPKIAYKKIPATFSAKGSSSYKFTWDFGDGTKSYKKTTTHTYKKKGTFKGSLTINNHFEETKKYFTIKVKLFSNKDISIIEIAANPPGTDSDNEYLLLKNSGKKEMDLSGWSIASGTQKKTLTNHPIRESFPLKKNEAKKLTSTFSSFTLPNQSGFIELRQPDGKVVQKINYQKQKGVAENEIYVLQPNNKWSWSQVISLATTTEDNSEEIEKANEVVSEDGADLKNIQLEDLAPSQMILLEAEVEKKLRAKIMAEVKEEMMSTKNTFPTNENQEETTINQIEDISMGENNLDTTSMVDSIMRSFSFGKILDNVFLKANASINDLLIRKS